MEINRKGDGVQYGFSTLDCGTEAQFLVRDTML